MRCIINKKGAMGVGVLIIFVSIILVAAVAASVILYTGGALQQKGIATGQDADKAVSTGLEVVALMGSDGSVGHDLETFEMIIRLASGSDHMKLNSTLLIMDTEATSQMMDFNATTNQFPGSTSLYNVEYLKRGPEAEDGYITRGDTVKIRFNFFTIADPTVKVGGIGENQVVRIRILPLVGTAAVVEFKTPDNVVVERFTLWP